MMSASLLLSFLGLVGLLVEQKSSESTPRER